MKIENLEGNLKIIFNANIIAGDISYDKNEVLDIKWISMNMTSKELKAYNSSMDIIKDVKQNKEYPLEIIKKLWY